MSLAKRMLQAEERELLEEIARDKSNRAAQIQALRMLRQDRGAGDQPAAGGKTAEADDPFAELDELAPRRKAG